MTANLGVSLYATDFESLRPGEYLTSNILSYCFAKARALLHECELQKSNGKSENGSEGRDASSGGVETVGNPSRQRVVFVDTSVAQVMVQFNSPELGPIEEINAADLVVIPVARYSTKTTDGTHWCLLLLLRKQEEARKSGKTESTASVAEVYLADSYNGYGLADAKQILRVLSASTLLEASESSNDKRSVASNSNSDLSPPPLLRGMNADQPIIRIPSFPQQRNSYDCGCYTVLAALQIAEKLVAMCDDDSVKEESDNAKHAAALKEAIQFTPEDMTPDMVLAFREALREEVHNAF